MTDKSRPASNSDRFRLCLATDDFEAIARRRLPKIIYNYVAGTAETGAAQAKAKQAYAALSLIPRMLVDVSQRSQERQLFGRCYSHPFGIAPLGAAAMVADRGDIAMADAAKAANIPMILSASSLIRLEEVRQGRDNVWFQIYLSGDANKIEPMLDRVSSAGFDTLVITGDTPVPGKRESALRSGFSMPLRLSPRIALDAALHPRWLFGVTAKAFLRAGSPRLENLNVEPGPPIFSNTATRSFRGQDAVSWKEIEVIRRHWRGRLILKGVLSVRDAALAREHGFDGLIVSNHGGRQLDHAVAPLTVLPGIIAASREMPVMIDGGIRRGTDVLKALALGAAFVFVGRPFLYAAFVGGVAGVSHAIGILDREIDTSMALMGVSRLVDLGPEFIHA